MAREREIIASICTCTYNGERVIGEYFSGIFSQDFPLGKVEIIIMDGGSSDETLKIVKKWKEKYPEVIKLFHNVKQYSIGKGFGMDQATRKAKGKYIVHLDQDNILIQRNWLNRIISILENNSKISGVQSLLAVMETASNLDKYINDLGIETPFAAEYSLNAQVVLNPWKFNYLPDEKIYTYEVNKKNFYYAGDNGFIIRREEFFRFGGYTQDIDNFWRMAQSKEKVLIAIPEEIKLYHKTSTSLTHMLKKRIYYMRQYLIENFSERDFYWINLKKNNFAQNFRFVKLVLRNLIIFPELIKSIEMAIRKKKLYWLMHPFILWIMTLGYIYGFFYVNIFKKTNKNVSI